MYKGKLMLVGGKVLSAERSTEGTKLEVLQVPLSRLIPDGPETESKGRFVVIDNRGQVSDPAIVNNEKRITVVGEVLGTTTVTIDEVRQSVPLVAIKHVTVWDWDRPKAGDARYYGYGYPIWGYRGYGNYAYPWW
jgi:outer membrane lipoprotein